jgi:predicted negative regulator of RcsB-dependent stress response
MTTPNFAAPSSGTDDNIADWLSANWRTLAVGAAIVAAAAGGYWLYERSLALKEEKAEKAFFGAQQSVASGNLDLAKSDLEKLVPRYTGTNAGTMGAMLLAQVLFEQGKPGDGVKVLQDNAGSAPTAMKASVEGLIGAGLSQQGPAKEVDAAAHYRKAAEMSVGADKDGYLAEAARSLTAAGKKAEARAIWAELAGRSDSPRAVEAKIRLGELDAKVQTR